jgi:hypothetical protein
MDDGSVLRILKSGYATVGDAAEISLIKSTENTESTVYFPLTNA